MEFPDLKILQIVGPKNSGKTRHVEWLTSSLKERGIRVGALKHSSHSHAIDRPGSDSYRLQQAGASPTVFWSASGLAVFYPQIDDKQASHLLSAIFSEADLIIVESFASAKAEKIVIDPDGSQWQQFDHVIGIISEQSIKTSLPVFKPFATQLIDFVIKQFHLSAK